MTEPIDDRALDRLWRKARSQNAWADKDVPEALVREIYDLARLGPTSGNSCPARFLFLRAGEARERLVPLLSEGNREKTRAAAWTVIVAYDMAFMDRMPELFPARPEMFSGLRDDPEKARAHALRNSALQGAYLMLAARAMGLDVGPMSGVDLAGVDREFFLDSSERRSWRADWLCNLGYGAGATHERLPRLDFETACDIL